MKYFEKIHEFLTKSNQPISSYVGYVVGQQQLLTKIQQFNTEFLQQLSEIKHSFFLK